MIIIITIITIITIIITIIIIKEQEEEKKRKYQQRVLDVEMGSFTPLVFGTNGGMGADCNCFLKRLAEKLSEKNEEPYHITITWIRTLLSFEILRSVHTCVRGSRTPFHKIPQGDFIDDCRLNASEAGVRCFFFFLKLFAVTSFVHSNSLGIFALKILLVDFLA